MNYQTELSRDQYVSDVIAAQILGLSRSYLRQCRVAGKGPPFSKLGNHAIRYRVGDLLDWARRKSVISTAVAVAN